MALLMLCVISIVCTIEAQAYGAIRTGQTQYAYVKLNGVAVWQASWEGEYPVYRGVNVIIVDRSTCTLQYWRNFDTHGRYAAAWLRDYLRGLNNGTVLIGVSADEASKELDAAKATLTALGANVSDVGWRGAWAFITKVGDPSSTVLDKELTESSALARDPVVRADFGGSSSGELTSGVSYIDAVANVVSNGTNFSIFRVNNSVLSVVLLNYMYHL